jgi:hypothetical protein
MAVITFDDKDKTLPTSDARRKVRDVDMNEIKTVVNENALSQMNMRGFFEQDNDEDLPDSGGSGDGGIIQAFNAFITTGVGVYGGEEWPAKTIIISLIDQPGQDLENFRLI